MPNWSNYANIFRKCYICYDISEKIGFILFIFGTLIKHNADLKPVKYTLALFQNVAVMFTYAYFVITVVCIFVISHI